MHINPVTREPVSTNKETQPRHIRVDDLGMYEEDPRLIIIYSTDGYYSPPTLFSRTRLP